MDENERDIRRLAMTAASLIRIFTEMWGSYEELFEKLDLDEPSVSERVFDAVAELEYNLSNVLDTIQIQLYKLSGVYEPLPSVSGGDFEADVLRDISKLGDIDLEKLRAPTLAEMMKGNGEDSSLGQWIDDLEGLTKEELIDKLVEARSIVDEFEDLMWNTEEEREPDNE